MCNFQAHTLIVSATVFFSAARPSVSHQKQRVERPEYETGSEDEEKPERDRR